MPGMGTIVNAAAIVVGTALGLLMKKGIPEKMSRNVTDAIGIAVALVGLSGVIAGLMRVGPQGLLERHDLMVLILSLVVGGVIGTVMDINDRFERLGESLSRRFSGEGDNRFAQGFVNASILFCVGAMAVVGALEDGLTGNPATLYAKSTMDGIMAAVLASSLGPGVGLSAAAVFLYQGAITLLSVFIKPLATDAALLQMSMVGSALIFALSLNMLRITRIKIADLIPATFIPLIWGAITQFI